MSHFSQIRQAAARGTMGRQPQLSRCSDLIFSSRSHRFTQTKKQPPPSRRANRRCICRPGRYADLYVGMGRANPIHPQQQTRPIGEKQNGRGWSGRRLGRKKGWGRGGAGAPKKLETYVVLQSRVLQGLFLLVALFPARRSRHLCCHDRPAVCAMVRPLSGARRWPVRRHDLARGLGVGSGGPRQYDSSAPVSARSAGVAVGGV